MSKITEHKSSATDKLEGFQRLSRFGFALIRLDKQLKPIEQDWERYNEENFPRYEDVGFQPDDNAGIIMGEISDVFAIEIFDAEEFNEFCRYRGWKINEKTLKIGISDGNTAYYLYKETKFKSSFGGGMKAVADSGIHEGPGYRVFTSDCYIVAPGSVCPNTGRLFEIDNRYPISSLPGCFLDLLGLARRIKVSH